MAKLFRPYIAIAVRVQVAERQLCAQGDWGKIAAAVHSELSLKARLANAIRLLFGEHRFELHHRPALCNRRRCVRNGKTVYDPPANSTDYLVYLAKDDHDIETRVRGVGAQHSDLGMRRKNKALARNREKRTDRASDIHAKLRPPKRKWASRPFPNGRKIATRRTT